MTDLAPATRGEAESSQPTRPVNRTPSHSEIFSLGLSFSERLEAMARRRKRSKSHAAKKAIQAGSPLSGEPDGHTPLSPADLRAVFRSRNERNFLPFEEGFDRDLFGEPVQARRGSGRPAHVPTPDTRTKVADLRERGLIIPKIAEAIGISHPTLMKNYPVELGSTSQTWRQRQSQPKKDS